MINVTKTFLPPQHEYQAILKRAWDKAWMTNRGVLVQELEAKLKSYLEVNNIITTTNGTLSMQVAIKALGLTGEIITTPFSYVATTSCIAWEGCAPVYVDIHPGYLTIDESKIEAAITDKTTAILVTHVFGNPCDVEAIEAIAKRYNLKVIYDAAHGFGVTYKGQSLFNYGDVSSCSFHATKLFHTGEGGAIFFKPEYYESIFYHHNFGHKGKEHFHGLGINAKMSELQAAMGLAVLPYIDQLIERRKMLVEIYDEEFKNVALKRLIIRPDTQRNYSYYPVIFRSETQLLKVKSVLEQHDIFPRRYFYPSLHTLPYVKSSSCPVSEEVSSSILCLPLYDGLLENEAIHIANLVKSKL